MRRDVKRLAVTGFVFLALGVGCLVFFEKLNEYGANIALITTSVVIIMSIIAFSISTNLIGKGDCLLLDNLLSGTEYVLIEHILVNGMKKFSLVGIPSSEKFVTIHADDRLFELGPGESFILIKREVRKLS